MDQSYDLGGRRVSSRYFSLLAVFAVTMLVLNAPSAWSQATSTGTVSGQLTDQQNAVLPGAEVTLLDAATNTSRSTTTNETGRYTFVNVHPGVYEIKVVLTGFAQTKVTEQKVSIGQVLTVNLTLKLGGLSETVQITSTRGAELQRTNATVGTTLTGKALEYLTNFGRDANSLFVLQPAVAPGGQVAGAVQDQNTYQLDGGNNTNDMDGTQNIYTPAAGFIGAGTGGTPSGVVPTPIESIEEFKVATTNQTADFNGSAGGQISMVTKRGTSQFHGSVYDHYFGSNFGANTWRNNHTPSVGKNSTPLPATHQNRFGASLGGPLTPSFLGGKTYFFFNYEGRRFPNSTTINKPVPTALLRAGVIQLPNSSGVYTAYNLNPTQVAVNGVTYQPANCGTNNVLCDPRGIGLNPVVSEIWSKFMPLPNDVTGGDRYNTQGYVSTVLLPQTSNFSVVRLDHDFGPKWKFLASYRWYHFNQLTTSQVDIGGALPGHTFGQAAASAPRPVVPSYLVGGLTTTITPRITNDFRVSYLRNWWQWSTSQAPPQLPGLGGAVEIGGESANALIPYNVNTQSVRQRFWDGQDWTLRDDLTWIRRNHMFQFGGLYERNYDFHQRDDNGQGIMAANVYQIYGNPGLTMANYRPSALPSTQNSNWDNLYAQVLGLVGQPQTLYTRSGSQLNLQPLGTPMFDQSIIPTYNMYFSDTWHMRPNFTLTYGLGYTVEMPPYEINGKQVALVDSGGNMVNANDYLAERKKAALAGQVNNPTLGFATITNVKGAPKYPYNPFYGGLSPRLAAAWSPQLGDGWLGKFLGHDNTVIRGGYSRIYGRLNGVDLVLVPLLGTGLGQAVSCQGAVNAANAVGGNQCLGVNGANPLTAFRIKTDGMTAPLPTVTSTLSQPYFPGLVDPATGKLNASAGDGSVLDPNFKPNRSDAFDFTIQREFSPKLKIEVGYIGRIIKNEYQSVNLDAVPTMFTLGGQTFANAFYNLYTGVTTGQTVSAQPFMETAFGGANSAYCTGFANCSAAVASKQASNIRTTRVYDLWNALNNAPGWALGRTMPSSSPGPQLSSVFMQNSNGFGNYNAAFASIVMSDWHGISTRSNFTWSRAFGTGAVTQSTSSFSVLDPWNLQSMYGPQSFDIRFIYNQAMLYQPPFFKGQQGVLGRMLGGWTFSPLFTAQSGAPLRVNISGGSGTGCQSFGEMNCSSGNTWENAIRTVPFTGGNSANYNVTVTSGAGITGNASTGGTGVNMYADPNAVYSGFRRLILGLDTTGGGNGVVRGFPTWNLDLSVHKEFHITERVGVAFLAQFANVMNHFQPGNPTLNIDSPQTWGVVTDASNTPRQMEFGLRIHF